MRIPGLVTFLTDFGHSSEYVAVCEAVMLRIDPSLRVLHLTHEVPVGNVAAGARILARVMPYCPPAVHLAVVDPGVGTARRAIVLATARGDFLVGPDNGLLVEAAIDLGELKHAWSLDPDLVREQSGPPATPLSATFHGRDLFAPAAALLARSVPVSAFARAVDPATLVRIAPPHLDLALPGQVVAEVVEVDRFGNVGLALRFDQFEALVVPEAGRRFQVDLPGEDLPVWEARLVRTFSDLHPGELGVYCDSWGQVALALNGASAAELLAVRCGTLVRLRTCPDSNAPGPGP
jgi:S-adenosylmethionine hydrolase